MALFCRNRMYSCVSKGVWNSVRKSENRARTFGWLRQSADVCAAGSNCCPTQARKISFSRIRHLHRSSQLFCQSLRQLSTPPVRHLSHSTDDETVHHTLDKSEVEKFSRLAAEWWNEQGEFGALHSLNTLRIPLVRDGLLANITQDDRPLVKPLSGLKILDVGCGGGIVSEPLARLGAEVLGIDASAENVAVAETHAADDSELDHHLDYRQCLVEELAAEAGPVYDGVIASEILEHVNDPRLFVQACCHLLKPSGSVFFTTMNRTPLAYALAVVAAEKIFRIVPDGAHDYEKFVTPDELSDMLKESGAEVRLVHGMCLNPVSLRWSWTPNTSINYALRAVKS